jgi:hypothetical protein
MIDPKRLLDEGDDDVGVALLRAGRTLDAEQARARKLAVLGAAGAGAAAATGLTAAKGFAHAANVLSVKWIGLGLLAAAVMTSTAALVSFSLKDAPPEGAPTPASTAAAGLPGRHVNEATANTEGDPANSMHSGSPGGAREAMGGAAVDPRAQDDHRAAEAREDTSTPKAAPKAASTGPAAEPAAPSGPSLAEEVEALKKAREALAAGRAKRALAALNVYDQRFRGGRLALEAEVLRIEALARSGQAEAASARAASFLAAHPSSPYAHRVRSIVAPPRREADTDDARGQPGD